jgi:ABC-type phosphate/phosphonate transport system substrate-binding protein
MNWLWQIAAKKAVISAVQAIIAILGQESIQGALRAAGINITIDPTVASAAAFGALEFLRNYLKKKLGVKFL